MGQTAPKGFLLAEKIAVAAFGRSDYAFRLFPLLCSLVGLLVFWRSAERLLDRSALPIAVALFALATPLITFGAEVKQYSSDVAVALLLLWLALELRPPNLAPRRALWIGFAGAALVWFSQPGILVAAALGAVLLSFALLRRRGEPGHPRLRPLAAALGCWAISAIGATVVALRSVTPETRAFLQRYWAAGFPPPGGLSSVDWLWHQVRLLVGTDSAGSLLYPAPTLYIGLAVLGFSFLWHRDRRLTSLLLAPMAGALIAAIARQYPFSQRLILFLVPNVLLGIAMGAGELVDWAARWWKPAGCIAIALLIGPTIYPLARSRPPYRLEDMKPVLAHLRAERQPGDAIYVFWGAAPEVEFYGENYGLRPDEYAVGGCHWDDTRSYLEELDAFRGRPRVWLLITHETYPYQQDYILGYLDTIGVRRDALIVRTRIWGRPAFPAQAFLYDLSDPARLERVAPAAADSADVPSGSPQSGCFEGPAAMVVPRGLPGQ